MTERVDQTLYGMYIGPDLAVGFVPTWAGSRWEARAGGGSPIDAGGFTGVRTFYAASTPGGAADILNTVTVLDGNIVAWTQVLPGAFGRWAFNDVANSMQVLTVGS